MIASRADRGKGGSALWAIESLLPGVVVDIKTLASIVPKHLLVGRHGRGETGVVDASVRPLGMPRVLEAAPGSHGGQRLGRVWYCCRRRAAVAEIRLPSFHIGHHQGRAGAIAKISHPQKAVRKKGTRTATPRGRIEYEPLSEVKA